MLIRGFGEFWNPDIVEWGSVGPGNRGKLKGTAHPDGAANFEVDVWDATAVYVLYSDFRPVYIGQADQRLGPRMRDHMVDRLGGRWDMFSWYSLSTLNKTTGSVRAPGKRSLKPKTVMDTIEAVLIQSLQPPLNRRYNRVPDATRVSQTGGESIQSIRSLLADILTRLSEVTSGEDSAASPGSAPGHSA